MNPVRTIGPAIAAGSYKGFWMYMVAPILGALAGAATYNFFKLPQMASSLKAQNHVAD
jgi:aquaporin NIP